MELKYGVYLIYNMYSEEEEDSSVEDVTPSTKKSKYSLDSLVAEAGQTKRKLLSSSIGGVIDRTKKILEDRVQSLPEQYRLRLRDNENRAWEWFRKLTSKSYNVTDQDIKDVELFLIQSESLERDALIAYKKEEEEEEVIDLTTSSTCMACLKQADNT
jgi:hypothetical protein